MIRQGEGRKPLLGYEKKLDADYADEKPLLGYEKKLDADYADDTDYSPP